MIKHMGVDLVWYYNTLPIKNAVHNLKDRGHVVYLSPQGQTLTQEKLRAPYPLALIRLPFYVVGMKA